jgi:hypothetical protein
MAELQVNKSQVFVFSKPGMEAGETLADNVARKETACAVCRIEQHFDSERHAP